MQVSFTISPEAAAFSTRADYPSNQYKTGHIGDGSKVDMLIYAVYDEYGNLLEDYCNGTDSELENKIEEHGKGQTIKYIKDGFPYTVNITLKKGVDYKIAFWAQSSETKAYNTSDLKKVEIRYNEIDNASGNSSDKGDTPSATESTTDKSDTKVTYAGTTPNNDEFRDAFCRSIEIQATNNSKQQKVYLYRPLSQINVGTSGYDYEIVTRDAKVKYTHSKIRINRVARYLDVVADKTMSTTTSEIHSEGDKTNQGDIYLCHDGKYRQQAGAIQNPETDPEVTPPAEAFSVVDFGYAPLPAYSNYREQLDNGDYTKYTVIPKYPSFTKWDWEYNQSDKDVPNKQTGWELGSEGQSKNPFHSDMKYEEYSKEEFLNVNLYNEEENTKTDGSFTNDFFGKYDYDENDNLTMEGDEYLDYANYLNYNDKKSETFKYLSMCYILTASTKEDPRVINNVKVWLASDEQGTNEYQILDLNYVPAQRNWRTNIVGELLTAENTFEIKMDQNFGGNINAWKDSNGTWEFSGPLASGVYYDAEKDEIQISSAEGLLWFQRMVNGTMKVRDVEDEFSNRIGQNYEYYKVNSDGSTQSVEFSYNGITKPSDEKLRERILRATHQYWNQNKENTSDGWPEAGNFHFVGKEQKDKDGNVIVKAQATVKLVADIDLTGMEWIPIGFEGRFGEQLGFTEEEASDNRTSNRVFYGIFDGNGHIVSNMSTKRFSAQVHDHSLQQSNYVYKGEMANRKDDNKTRHPADNPQWWGRGFFGQIGGDAKVLNLTLINVDVYGCNGVAGIVGLAYGGAIEINNCVVDGGSIIATPMYRGDNESINNNKVTPKDRTFARGVYMGGIVGYFNTYKGKVNNCIVRNVHLQGVRRVGGIIGSINQALLGDGANDEGKWMVDGSKGFKQRASTPDSIFNNRIENTILIASSYSTYGMRNEYLSDTGRTRTGFGWNTGNLSPYAQKFVGGSTLSESERTDLGVYGNNIERGLTYSFFPIEWDGTNYTRRSSLGKAPLDYLPMLSSWYADEIYLTDDYFGDPSGYKIVNLHDFHVLTTKTKVSGYTNDNASYDTKGYLKNNGSVYRYPMIAPAVVDVDFDTKSGRAGVLIESVTLNGYTNMVGHRSVITSTNTDKKGDCVAYIAPRNRHQFGGDNYKTKVWPGYVDYENDDKKNDGAIGLSSIKIPTIIKNMVFRGYPYAYAGISFAPNKNMLYLELDSVAIYDVYKTLEFDPGTSTSQKKWPNINDKYDAARDHDPVKGPEVVIAKYLKLKDCNLRGYTVPGNVFKRIMYENTTFEEGTNINPYFPGQQENDIKTCLVEAPTYFDRCYFKDHFFIVLGDTGAPSWEFTNCYATATATVNNKIDLSLVPNNETCYQIEITSNAQGEPLVTYYTKEGKKYKYDFNHNLLAE